MSNYFEQFNHKHFHPNINKLEEYAKNNHVPIIMKDSLLVILNLLAIIKPKNVLEIGTAIGYSSICMSYYSKCYVDTIERDDEMFNLASKNIVEFGLDKHITIHHADALEIDVESLSTYDIIFIDAAKAQNIKFFEKFSPLLNEGGLIITDNLMFHGAIDDLENQSKNVRKMVEKIDKYNNYLHNLTEYESIFINVGDGISITKKVTK